MTNYGDFYHCQVCGHVVSIVHEGNPTLVCCEQPMTLLIAKTADTGKEKHVPVIVPGDGSTLIKVGSVEHPMTPEHYISFIEVVAKDTKRTRANLTDKPEAEFMIDSNEIAAVYEYCNLHGLWAAYQ